MSVKTTAARQAQARAIASKTNNGMEMIEFFIELMNGAYGPNSLKERVYAANWLDERLHGKLPDNIPDPYDGLTEEEVISRLKIEIAKRENQLQTKAGSLS